MLSSVAVFSPHTCRMFWRVRVNKSGIGEVCFKAIVVSTLIDFLCTMKAGQYSNSQWQKGAVCRQDGCVHLFYPAFQGAAEKRREAAGRPNRKCNGNSVNSCHDGHASQTVGNNRPYEKLLVCIAGGIWFIQYVQCQDAK